MKAKCNCFMYAFLKVEKVEKRLGDFSNHVRNDGDI